MNYFAMDPPFEIKEFREMRKREAQQYFDWFISQIPHRLNQLETLYTWSTESGAHPLDFSRESLAALWEWFIPLVESESKSPEQIKKELANLPEWRHKVYLEQSPEFTLATHSFITDICIYFGEVFRKEFPALQWGLVTRPKLLYCVNRPVIVSGGSNFELDPRHLVYIQTLKVQSNKSNNQALLELFDIRTKSLK
ncbi:hypothetical protein [Planococcus sp. CAU13]|uniref:hypothetical protein n=1 Tax=Planococcus sp. CAU13 TaxID=1541197 RepID=UPI00052FF9E5|nr:hypothetical protein [Planococcus sp. CAU13]